MKVEPGHFNALPRGLVQQMLVLRFRRGQQRVRKLLIPKNVDVAADLTENVPRGRKVDGWQLPPPSLLPHQLLLHGRYGDGEEFLLHGGTIVGLSGEIDVVQVNSGKGHVHVSHHARNAPQGI